MVMEGNEQPPAPITEASTPQVVERPLWELSRDEQRVLIITFIGGLASVVAGACVIGAAIALVRAVKPHYGLMATLIIFTPLYFIAMAWSFNVRRRRRGRRPLRMDMDLFILWLILCLVLFILLLVWIGIAAGIH